MCYVLFSYAYIPMRQGLKCKYVFVTIYIFMSPFHDAKFGGVLSCVFDKLGCAAGEKKLQNTGLE
jgi:hypothetical protein